MKLHFTLSVTDRVSDASTVFEWRPDGSYIAIAIESGVSQILDRYGQVYDEFTLPGSALTLKWDKNGEVLAAICSNSTILTMYDMTTKQTMNLDISMGMKETPSFAAWSITSPVLAIGTSKGNIVFFNHESSRKVPIMGKHQRAITTGAFGEDGTLALGSEDASITLSNPQGDTVSSFSCNAEPKDLQFVKFTKFDDREGKMEAHLSAIIGKKAIMIIKLNEPDNPINLQFQEAYGNIINTIWYNNGYLLLGFEQGYICCISAQRTSEISQEIFSVKEFNSYLSNITICKATSTLIAIGDNSVKVRKLDHLNDLIDMTEALSDPKGLTRAEPNDDGTLVAISGKSGAFSVYLTKLPRLGAASKGKVVVLSSLSEIRIIYETESRPSAVLNVKMEPSLLAIGQRHVAVVLNNRAWFYELRGSAINFLCEFEYISTVIKMKLNRDFAMAKMDGRAHVHRITQQGEEDASIIFPSYEHHTDNAILVEADLTEKFFVYCTDMNRIHYFSLADWTYISEYKHNCSIRSVYAENSGIRVCFFDERYDTYIYCPAAYEAYKLPDVKSSIHYEGCLWEEFTVDKDTFIVYDKITLFVFIASRTSNGGLNIEKIGTTKISLGHEPIMLSKGIVSCLADNGQISTVLLDSQKTDMSFEGKSTSQLETMLRQALVLKRWRNAWRICEHAKSNAFWQALVDAALQNMMPELAIRVYKHIGKVAMAWALEEVAHIEERSLLSGHLAVALGKYDEAEKNFLQSRQPMNALELRRDILHWDKASQLAAKMAPSELKVISKEYAIQLEMMGNYEEALHQYEGAIISDNNTDSDKADEVMEHNEICQCGIARMAIRLGDIRRGIEIAESQSNRAIKRDCGLILEQMKQYQEAAHLYEIGAFYDRAAAAYCKSKNWSKVGQLAPNVRSPKILIQYGKVLEATGKFEDALKIYEKAGSYDDMVRIMLEKMHMTDEAVRVARDSRSNEGAKLVSKYFMGIGDYESAIQFLVISQCYQEAFQMADAEDKMLAFADAIEREEISEQYPEVAEYYAQRKNPLMAGKFFMLAGNYKQALDHLLQTKDNDEGIRLAIRSAAKAQDRDYTKRVIDFLMGEVDSTPKDPKFLFQLYVSLKMYTEAAKTAIIIAQDEQNRGNYKVARDLLFRMHQQLVAEGLQVPAAMKSSLMLLHSYMIAKTLIKENEHKRGARMLVRISNNISAFPSHTVPILTSTVIACAKAGLKETAFKFAVQLLQPQNRKNINEKYRKKIEAIVR